MNAPVVGSPVLGSPVLGSPVLGSPVGASRRGVLAAAAGLINAVVALVLVYGANRISRRYSSKGGLNI